MAGILNRLRRNLDGLLAPAPPPIPPSTSPLATFEAHLSRVQSSRQHLERTQQSLIERQALLHQQVEELHAEATSLVGQGRPDLARMILTRRRAIRSVLTAMERQHHELAAQITRLIDVEQHPRARIEARALRRDLISAQHQAALARIHVGEALTGISDAADGSVDPYRAEEEVVATLQARASALRRLIDDGLLDLEQPDDLGLDAEAESAIDAELAAIQQQTTRSTPTQR